MFNNKGYERKENESKYKYSEVGLLNLNFFSKEMNEYSNCLRQLRVFLFHFDNSFEQVDKDYLPGLMCIRDMEADPAAFASMDMPFSTPSAAGHEVPLSAR